MMKEKHIIGILDNSPLASLTESELLAVRGHAENCPSCRRAYEAAQLSTLLIKERAAETIEALPFFQTRVLAALREQQASNNAPVLSRLWKSAGALVSSMAVTTAALAAFSFLAPGAGTGTTQETTAALSPYSAEAVVFNQDQSDDQMTDEQVLSAIYADPDEAR
jgi:predicted anti-sigma-YlaC factor YlaD